jgi:ethanolamine utilization protein EutM
MQAALGIIETRGFTTAMQAADAAVKAANIELGDWLKVGGGKVNIIIRGDVAAVKAAVEAGVEAASQIGEVHGQTVIPRPADKLVPTFPIDLKKTGRSKK